MGDFRLQDGLAGSGTAAPCSFPGALLVGELKNCVYGAAAGGPRSGPPWLLSRHSVGTHLRPLSGRPLPRLGAAPATPARSWLRTCWVAWPFADASSLTAFALLCSGSGLPTMPPVPSGHAESWIPGRIVLGVCSPGRQLSWAMGLQEEAGRACSCARLLWPSGGGRAGSRWSFLACGTPLQTQTAF